MLGLVCLACRPCFADYGTVFQQVLLKKYQIAVDPLTGWGPVLHNTRGNASLKPTWTRGLWRERALVLMYLVLHSIKSLVFGTCSLWAKVHRLLSKTELKSVVAQRGEERKNSTLKFGHSSKYLCFSSTQTCGCFCSVHLLQAAF